MHHLCTTDSLDRGVFFESLKIKLTKDELVLTLMNHSTVRTSSDDFPHDSAGQPYMECFQYLCFEIVHNKSNLEVRQLLLLRNPNSVSKEEFGSLTYMVFTFHAKMAKHLVRSNCDVSSCEGTGVPAGVEPALVIGEKLLPKLRTRWWEAKSPDFYIIHFTRTCHPLKRDGTDPVHLVA